MTLWTRIKVKWLTRKLERKQSAARGVAPVKRANGIHKASVPSKDGIHR